jgi:hydrogenase-4 component B
MEFLGGLIKRMPWTAATFLVASVAISGLPPLNGFVSEWLTFQALLQNLRVPSVEVNLLFALALAALALTAGLAAAASVRAFGISFLALPRTDVARNAHEAPVLMRTAMVALSVACVGLGVGAPLVLPVLVAVAATLPGFGTAPLTLAPWGTILVTGQFAGLSMPAIAVVLVAALAAPLVLMRLAGTRTGHRTYETWGCGRMLQTPRMEYTAAAFANPFKRVFDFFYRPEKRVDVAVHPESRLFVTRMTYASRTRPVFEDWLYRPMLGAIHRVSATARAIQSGSPNVYLAYILAALVLMLVLA